MKKGSKTLSTQSHQPSRTPVADSARSRPSPALRSVGDNLGWQRTLRVSQQHDALEVEAREGAERFVRGKEVQIGNQGQQALLQRERRSASQSVHASPVQMPSLNGRGKPLSAEIRAPFEHGIGHNFSHVRIHDDARAASMAAEMEANAFTHGNDIVFGAGQFSPSTISGRRLLAHELIHTVQQRENATLYRDPVTSSGGPEATLDDLPLVLADPATLTNQELIDALASQVVGPPATEADVAMFAWQQLVEGERARRISLGHLWLAAVVGAETPEIYQLTTLPDGTVAVVVIENDELVYGAPTDMSLNPLVTEAQIAQMARQMGLEQMSIDEYLLQTAEPGPAMVPDRPPLRPVASPDSWELGPRGERMPTGGWDGGPLRALDEYTKPYARMYAERGNYEAAELAENYLCATCHVLTKVDPAEFSIRGYSESWQRGYVQGFVEIPLRANPVGAAWSAGVSLGEAITGEGSGLQISNISWVLVNDRSDLGRRLSVGERAARGAEFALFALTLGLGRGGGGSGGGGGRPGNPFANLADDEIEAALSGMSSRHFYRGPVSATEAGFAPEAMVPVSRWGRPGLQPGDWVMNGPPNFWSYARSFKWEPNPTNIRAPFAAGEGYIVPPQHVVWPRGWSVDGWIKGLYGQRRYLPPGSPP